MLEYTDLDSRVKNRYCPACGKFYSHYPGLHDHYYSVHLLKKPYGCDHCNKRFANKQSFTKHVKLHENPEGTPFKCDRGKCKRCFVSQLQLDTHIEDKHTTTKFPCAFCGIEYASKSRAAPGKGHNCKNKKTDPFVCDTCGKVFNVRGSYTTHRLTHDPNRIDSQRCIWPGCLFTCADPITMYHHKQKCTFRTESTESTQP